MRLKLMLLSLAVVPVSLFAALGTSWAAPIEISAFLANPSFELPVVATGVQGACPTSWTCFGSPSPGFGTYQPTTAQYTPVTDGILGIVPDGKQAANSPFGLSGSGNLQQITSHTWVAGQPYTFTFSVGRPNKEPDGTTLVTAWPGTVRLYILSNGVADNLSGSGPIQFDIPDPGAGKWLQITESFTPGQNTGQTIGVQFFVSTTNNNQEVNFDIGAQQVGGAIPEPASLLLLGSGLAGLGAWRWKKSQR